MHIPSHHRSMSYTASTRPASLWPERLRVQKLKRAFTRHYHRVASDSVSTAPIPVIDTCVGVAPTPPHRARTYKPRLLGLPPAQHQHSNNGDGRMGRVDGAVRRGEMIVFKCRRVMILPMLIFVWECHSKTPAKGMAARRAHVLTLGLLQSDSRAGS